MKFEQIPKAKVQMLMRVPAARAFEAFVDPNMTTKFWFTHGDGSLVAGKRVTWRWEMYNVSVPVSVIEIEPNKRILIEWGNGDDKSTVEWTFEPHTNDSTLVKITNDAFIGNGDEIVAKAIDSMGGFAFVLSGAKAYLEHGIQLNLIADCYPT